MAITNATLATAINDLIAYWASFNEEYANWLSGSVGGGPNLDGDYPITDYEGTSRLVACPAQLEDDVNSLVTGAAGHKAAAEVAQTAAEVAQVAAELAETGSEAARDLALAYRDAALAAQTAAESARTTAIAQAAVATANAAQTTLDAAATAADAISTAADAASAAASAAAAATFVPALYAALADSESITGLWTFNNDFWLGNAYTFSMLDSGGTARDVVNMNLDDLQFGSPFLDTDIRGLTITMDADVTAPNIYSTNDGTFTTTSSGLTGIGIKNPGTSNLFNALEIQTGSGTVFQVRNNGDIHGDERLILQTGEAIEDIADGWLRLNQNQSYVNGVYTPGNMRVESGLTVAGTSSMAATTFTGDVIIGDVRLRQSDSVFYPQTNGGATLGGGTNRFAAGYFQVLQADGAATFDGYVNGALKVYEDRQAAGLSLDTLNVDGVYHLSNATGAGHPAGDTLAYGNMMVFDNLDVHTQVYFSRHNDGRIYTRTKSVSDFTGVAWNRIWSSADFDYTDLAVLTGINTFTGVQTFNDGIQVDGLVDNDVMIDFNMDRPWRFMSQGEDATNKLELQSINDKNFVITNSAGSSRFTFATNTGIFTASGSVDASGLNINGNADVIGNLDVLDSTNGNTHFNFTGGNNYISRKAGAATYLRTHNGSSSYTTQVTINDSGVTVNDGPLIVSGGVDDATVFEDSNVCFVPNGGINDDEVHMYPSVRGGSYNSNASTVTGYLRIRYPYAMTGQSVMHSFLIQGYNYAGPAGTVDGGGWCIQVSGYAYSSENWNNFNCRIVYGSPPFSRVRFGEDETGDYKYILLGESTTEWNYPQVMIKDLMTGFAGQYGVIGSGQWLLDISASLPSNWSQDADSGTQYVGGQIRWDGDNSTVASSKNLGGRLTISTGAASGGQDGDIHFQY